MTKRESEHRNTAVSRREMIQGAAGLLTAGSLAASAAENGNRAPEAKPAVSERVRASHSNPIVETASGKVRGYVDRGVSVFGGIPYAAPAGGALVLCRPRRLSPGPATKLSDVRTWVPKRHQHQREWQ